MRPVLGKEGLGMENQQWAKGKSCAWNSPATLGITVASIGCLPYRLID